MAFFKFVFAILIAPHISCQDAISSSRKAAMDFGAKIAKNPDNLTTDAVQKFKKFSNNFADMMSSNIENELDFFANLALIDACMPQEGRNCLQVYEDLKENLSNSFVARSREFSEFSRANVSNFIKPELTNLPQRKYLKNKLSSEQVLKDTWTIGITLISAAGPKGLVLSKFADSAFKVFTLFGTHGSKEEALGEMIKEGNANIMERLDQVAYLIQDQLKHYFDYIGTMFQEINDQLSTIQSTLNKGITLLNNNDLSLMRRPVAILMYNIKLFMKDPTNPVTKQEMLSQCKNTRPINVIAAYEHKLLENNYLHEMSSFYEGNLGFVKEDLFPLCRDLIVLPFLVTKCSTIDNDNLKNICSKESITRSTAAKVINGLLSFTYDFEKSNNIALVTSVRNIISFEIKNVKISSDHYSYTKKIQVALDIKNRLTAKFRYQYNFAVLVFAEFDIYHVFDEHNGMNYHAEWTNAQRKDNIAKLNVVVFWNNVDNEVFSPEDFPFPYSFRKSGNDKTDNPEDLKTHLKEIMSGHEMKNQNTCVLGSVLQYIPMETSRKQINSEKEGVASDKIIMSSSINGMHVKLPGQEETQSRFVNTPEIWLRYMPFDVKVTYEQAKIIFAKWRAGATMEQIVKITNKAPRKGSMLLDYNVMGYNSFEDTLGKEFETYEVEYRPSIVYFFKGCTEDKPMLNVDKNVEEKCLKRLKEAKNMINEAENELAKIDG